MYILLVNMFVLCINIKRNGTWEHDRLLRAQSQFHRDQEICKNVYVL